MSELAQGAIGLCNTLAQKTELTEHERQLYEAAARFTTTILKFQDTVSQSALIEAERELHALSGVTQRAS
jgi:hypothetical protein